MKLCGRQGAKEGAMKEKKSRQIVRHTFALLVFRTGVRRYDRYFLTNMHSLFALRARYSYLL